ncbi:MAG TPA: hypothetical protein VF786_02055, partial [Terriglobales bacterium]
TPITTLKSAARDQQESATTVVEVVRKLFNLHVPHAAPAQRDAREQQQELAASAGEKPTGVTNSKV